MSLDLLSELLGNPEPLLHEAVSDSTTESTTEPTDNEGEETNNDLEQDKTDVESDKEDTSSDNPDDSSEDDSADDSSGTGDDDQSDSQDGNDTSTSAPFEDSAEAEAQNKEKKFALYTQLKDIRVSFKSTASMLETLLTSDLPDANLETVRFLRQRVGSNVESLDALLSNAKIASAKTYGDLLVLHNIYISDLTVIDVNLKAFIRLLDARRK